MCCPKHLILILFTVFLHQDFVQSCNDEFKDSFTQEIKQLLADQFNAFGSKLDSIHYRLDQMAMMGVQIGIIEGDMDALNGRTSQSQLATEDVKRMQEQMNNELQIIKNKVQSYEAHFTELKIMSSNSLETAEENFSNVKIGITNNADLLQNVSGNVQYLEDSINKVKININENTGYLKNITENKKASDAHINRLNTAIGENKDLLKNMTENAQYFEENVINIINTINDHTGLLINLTENAHIINCLKTAIGENNDLQIDMRENVINITITINDHTGLLINLTGNVQYFESNFADHTELINNVTENVNDLRDSATKPRNCHDIYVQGERLDGIFIIYPIKVNNMFETLVRCQFDVGSEVGWTIILARMPTDNPLDFKRDWEDYKAGFGDVYNEYWIGLSVLHEILISYGPQVLYVDMMDWDHRTAYAQYKDFSIGDESSGFKLSVGGFSGDAGNYLNHYNGMKFTTKDKDNDKWGTNCANESNNGGSGFWYKSCTYGNHQFRELRKKGDGSGVQWYQWKQENLKKISFKIRPKDI